MEWQAILIVFMGLAAMLAFPISLFIHGAFKDFNTKPESERRILRRIRSQAEKRGYFYPDSFWGFIDVEYVDESSMYPQGRAWPRETKYELRKYAEYKGFVYKDSYWGFSWDNDPLTGERVAVNLT